MVTITVSPASMGARAADASLAISMLGRIQDDAELLEKQRRGIADGLRQGLEFCKIFEKGVEAKSATNRFSVDAATASRFADTVMRVSAAEDLQDQLKGFHILLQSLFDAVREGKALGARDEELQPAAELFRILSGKLIFEHDRARRLSASAA